MATIKNRTSVVDYFTAYSDQSENTEELNVQQDLNIPEDLSTLGDAELQDLHDQAVSAFDDLYEQPELTDEDMETLAELTEVIEDLQEELGSREEAANARLEKAAELAAKIGRGGETLAEETEAEATEAAEELATEEAEEEATEELATEDAAEEATETEELSTEEVEAVTASSKPRPRSIRVPLANVRGRSAASASVAEQQAASKKPTIKDYLIASGDGLGKSVGSGVDFIEAGEMLDRRLNSFPQQQYEAAQRSGRQLSERHSLISIQRPIPEELKITRNDPAHVNEVFDYATNESRLKGGSLVAAGGWCAPSEVLYDLGDEFETREGLLSLPEIGAPRGGISFTTGVDFRDLYAAVQEGAFSFSEAEDIAGNYDGTFDPENPEASGAKPCFRLDCPPFEEYRLDVDGLCVTAGILESRGYPELQARNLRGVLVAHDHLMNGKMIAQMAAGSDATTLPATQAGTTAPLLTAIELQTEHYRYSRRMARGTTLEAVFPYWIRGAIRSDLSRRLGVDLLSVPNARIDAWFAERGIAPQFVYNWQAIDTTAGTAFDAWPTEVSFLLYAAGTWVRGINDIITLDTMYDSVLLGQNDFTALFTEEGWFVAKRGQDSRLVTTSISADGATHVGVEIAHNGTIEVADAGTGE